MYEKLCLDRFIYAEPVGDSATGVAKRYFDIDLSNLRNFKHAYLFCPSPIIGYANVGCISTTLLAPSFPVKLFLYVLE
jgi:hypothetical protein